MAAQLADFRLDRRIGSGASGEVYEALPLAGGPPVAVKIIFPHLSESADNLARFERQCRLLSTVDHPVVVPVLSWGFCEERRQLFLSMPLLRGQTLGAHMRDASSTLELLELVDTVLQGLAAAHAKGLVHRDVKPDNIFVLDGDPPEARLIDFGLVRQVDATGPTATQMGLGTPSYMAPEQATSARSVGVAADVWSLGVVFYRIVSGRLPFTGEGPYETMIRVVSMPPPPLPGVPEPLQELVFACLQKEPEKRPPDARAVRSALAQALDAPGVRGWLRERPWHGAREPTVEPFDPTWVQSPTSSQSPGPARAEEVSAAAPPAPARPAARWPWAAALAGVLLLLGLAPLWLRSGTEVEPVSVPVGTSGENPVGRGESGAVADDRAPLPDPLPPQETAEATAEAVEASEPRAPAEGGEPDAPEAARPSASRRQASNRDGSDSRPRSAAAAARKSGEGASVARAAKDAPAATGGSSAQASERKRAANGSAPTTAPELEGDGPSDPPPESEDPSVKDPAVEDPTVEDPTDEEAPPSSDRPKTKDEENDDKEDGVDPRDILTF